MKSPLFFILAVFNLFLAIQAQAGPTVTEGTTCGKSSGVGNFCGQQKRDIALGMTSLPRRFVEALRQERDVLRLDDQIET